jgi:O-antigen ligase
MFLCVLNADNVGIALKFFLAKIWYVMAWFILPLILVKKDKDVYTFLWCMLIPLTFAVIKVVLHHATFSFGFREINLAVVPFFRNHVNYAAHLSLMLPFVWFLIFRQKRCGGLVFLPLWFYSQA